jgi:hypothetical protein
LVWTRGEDGNIHAFPHFEAFFPPDPPKSIAIFRKLVPIRSAYKLFLYMRIPPSSLKFLSLAGLGGGVLGLSQNASAQILYTPLNVSVGFAGGDQTSYELILPSTGPSLNFRRHAVAGTNRVSVAVGGSHAYVRGFGVDNPALTSAGPTHLHVGNVSTKNASLEKHTFYGADLYAKNFDHKYMAFTFSDAGTQKYGWVELSGQAGTPSITVEGWAYDTTGATIAMGAMPVPEPQSAAMATGAALIAGAAGLRAWRKSKAPTTV